MAYLDYAASTPLRPEAIAAMTPFLAQGEGAAQWFGNPSGTHAVARSAKTALEEAREKIAVSLGARPSEIVFTGSGSESDNLAVKGAARAGRDAGKGPGIVTTAFEHKAVLASFERLERDGFEPSIVRVTASGVLDLDALAGALSEGTSVVSVMLVNNEVGTIQPLSEIAAIVRERAPRALIHTDAVQGVPWLDVAQLTKVADLVSISAHKFGGPKGIGALIVRSGVRIEPLIEGGGQEAGLRSGTSNVMGAVAMAAALEVTTARRSDEVVRIAALRDQLQDGLLSAIGDASSNGELDNKIAGNSHITFPGIEVEMMLLALDARGVCASAGSSCQSGSMDPSYVLSAMGMDRRSALASVRFSLGWPSTQGDIDTALEVVPDVVASLRSRRSARSR